VANSATFSFALGLARCALMRRVRIYNLFDYAPSPQPCRNQTVATNRLAFSIFSNLTTLSCSDSFETSKRTISCCCAAAFLGAMGGNIGRASPSHSLSGHDGRPSIQIALVIYVNDICVYNVCLEILSRAESQAGQASVPFSFPVLRLGS
jgi:hypothetical protein